MKERVERYSTAAEHDLRCAELFEAGAIIVSWVADTGNGKEWVIKWKWTEEVDNERA